MFGIKTAKKNKDVYALAKIKNPATTYNKQLKKEKRFPKIISEIDFPTATFVRLINLSLVLEIT
jgi:hypothetical protein